MALVHLDSVSTEDLAHLLAAQRMAGVPTPAEQREALREWDETCERLSDQDRDIDGSAASMLEPGALRYLDLLGLVTAAGSDMAGDEYRTEVQTVDSLIRAAVEREVDPDDAYDAVRARLATAAEAMAA